jgi:hypothetical protein
LGYSVVYVLRGKSAEILKRLALTDSVSGGIRSVADGEIKWLGSSSLEILKSLEMNSIDA